MNNRPKPDEILLPTTFILIYKQVHTKNHTDKISCNITQGVPEKVSLFYSYDVSYENPSTSCKLQLHLFAISNVNINYFMGY